MQIIDITLLELRLIVPEEVYEKVISNLSGTVHEIKVVRPSYNYKSNPEAVEAKNVSWYHVPGTKKRVYHSHKDYIRFRILSTGEYISIDSRFIKTKNIIING